MSAAPTIFIYDNYPGGIGFSEPLHSMHAQLIAQTRELIDGCPCKSGCPSCVGPEGATGPLAPLFHGLAGNSSAVHAIDLIVPIGLLLVGLSLMLGLLTQLGCIGAIGFLAMFYLSQPPFSGMPQAGAEGTYLLVNKNLIELAAVLAILAFRTGRIAGLDTLRAAKLPVRVAGVQPERS